MEEVQTPQEESRAKQEAQPRSEKKGGVGKVVAIAIVLALIIGLGVWFIQRGGPSAAAVVNGESILMAEYQDRIEQLETSYEVRTGTELDDPAIEGQIEEAAIQDLINERLLLEAAEDAGITISEEQVEQGLQEQKDTYPTEEAYQADLERFNLTEAVLKENIRKEIKVFSYVRSIAPAEDLAVTDAEVQELYDLNVAALPEPIEGEEEIAVPTFEEFAPQGRRGLETQKLRAAVSPIIEELRSQAEIEILVEFPEANAPQVDTGTIEPPAEEPPVEEGEATTEEEPVMEESADEALETEVEVDAETETTQ